MTPTHEQIAAADHIVVMALDHRAVSWFVRDNALPRVKVIALTECGPPAYRVLCGYRFTAATLFFPPWLEDDLRRVCPERFILRPETKP